MNEIEMVEARESLGLLDHIPIGMFVLREDFVVLFWNGCLEDWTGISRSEIVGVDIGTLFPHLSDPKYVDRLRSVFEGGSPVVFSSQLHQHIIPVPLPDGRLRVQHTTVTSIPASDGAGFHALFAIQDVTNLTRQTQEHRVMLGQAREEARERGRAEEALRASEERFKQFFEYEPGYCYIISPDGVILDVNNAALEALGYEEEEIVGKPQEMIYAPDSLLKMEQLFARWKETGEFKDEETVIITKNGDRRNVILSTGAVKGQDGEVLHSVSVQRDITEHKWAEEALRESEARYRTLFDSAGDAIFIYDLEGYFLGVNQVACERLGYSQEELLQMTAMDIGSPEYTNLMPERVEQLRRRGQTFFETAHVCQDGTLVPVELNSRIIEYRGISAVLSIARDITGRKQAEEALRQSEERYRAVAEAAVAGIIIVDTKRNLTFVNPAFAEMVGYPQDDLLGMNLSQLMNPEEFARFQKQTLRSNKGVRSHYETTLRRQDGIALSVIASASPLTASDGSFQGTLSVVVDITERKQSEKALRASEALYHSTIEAMDDAIHVVDTDLRFILFNTAFRQWVKELDLETTSEVGRKLVKELSLLPDQILDEYRQVFKTGETLVTEDTIEIAGQGFFTETRKIPVFEGGRVTRVVTVVRDITERKRAEGALKKAYDELELRVEERTAELTVANEQLGQEVNERKRVEEALQRQLEELIVLHTIATAAAEATDEDALIERAVQAIGK
ncbi:MAG: PAS domain S-box protein, partial [Chloroflexota bacterium]|nr:PAS domain S-box protein [Chloroflexota bacterium]